MSFSANGFFIVSQLNSAYQLLKSKVFHSSLRDVQTRRERLLSLQKEIKLRRAEIIEAVYLDFKKNELETDLTEIHTTLSELKFTLSHLNRWVKPKRVSTPLTLFLAKSYLCYEPKGLVLIMAPWNYPFSLLMNGLIAAIAAGNLAILRPSEKAPHTSKIIEKIIKNVFKEDEVFVALGELSVSIELLELEFDHIFYTGSTRVGKIVMEKASKNLTPVTLELGGKSPVIVDENYDLEDFAEKIVWGKFVNAGQTCVAPDYILVPSSKKEVIIAELKKNIEKYYGATNLDRKNSKSLARIIDASGFDRLNGLCLENENLLEGKRDRETLYFPPTILDLNKNFNHKSMEDEIFGPILPLVTYDHLDEAIEFIQKRPKPLALYLFTFKKDFFNKVFLNTTSGGMVHNHVLIHLANKKLPFGGVGHSGMGSYHGLFGFKAFSHERALLKQTRITLSKLYFPPYDLSWKKVVFNFLRWFE